MRTLKMIAVLLLSLIVVFALWLRWNEPNMIYYPDRHIDQTPDQVGFKYEDVTLTTSDGIRINGWYLPSPEPANANPGATLTVLLFHGNAGNMSHRFEKLAVLRELGVDTFIIDYRGYGRSGGKPDEQGTYRDARAAYDHLIQQRKLSPRSIVVYGESLGSAVAADLATKVNIGGLILEEAFTSVGDVGQKMFPFLPIRWLVWNKYDTLSKMPRVKVPLLIFHSRDDELFSLRHAQRLLAAANDPKQLVELRGNHNDAFLVSASIYHDALQKFFATVAATTP
ncbi:MAG: alpha/beta hydrolase [Verrucomicrobiia bacterium]|jgi:fermentation-respiration switch protein FrsA (DUF1100 family)